MIRYIKKRSDSNNASEDKSSIEETVRSILGDIRERGDTALEYYSGHFDNWSPENFRLSEDEIDAAISKLNKSEYFLAISIYQSKMLGAMCRGGDILWLHQHI